MDEEAAKAPGRARGERLERCQRLRKRREFLRVQQNGKKVHLQDLVALCLVVGEGRRLGVTVSRRVGNAVQRNRIKRWLREAWRRQQARFPDGYDVVLVAKQRAAEADFSAICRQVALLAGKLERDKRGRA